MLINNIITSKIIHKNIASFCPNCFRVDNIGNVEIDVKLELSPDAIMKTIDIHEHAAMNLMPNSNSNNLINVCCHDCGSNCIIVDSIIADHLAYFNANGYTTNASCDGNDCYCIGYIRFTDVGFTKFKEALKKYAEKSHRSIETVISGIMTAYHLEITDSGIYDANHKFKALNNTPFNERLDDFIKKYL